MAGPLLNVYNERAAQFLAARGAVTLCTPVELPLTSVALIARACPELEIEVFAFRPAAAGPVEPLLSRAVARAAQGTPQFVYCEKDPDGLTVDTIDGQRFLAVNGVQTLSQGVQAYCPTAEEAASFGIRRLRLSPHTVDMCAVSAIYRDLLDGVIAPARPAPGFPR